MNKHNLLAPHRQRIVGELLAWATFFERKASEATEPYLQEVLRSLARTVHSDLQTKLRNFNLEFDEAYTWLPLEDEPVNPPLLVANLLEGEIGIHYLYGYEDVARYLSQLSPVYREDESLAKRAMANSRRNLQYRLQTKPVNRSPHIPD